MTTDQSPFSGGTEQSPFSGGTEQSPFFGWTEQSPFVGGIETRKADHIRINLDEDVGFDRLTVGFENYRFIHQALPELDLRAVDLTTRLFDKPLKAPMLISSMTGGTEQAQQINLNLAAAAQQIGRASCRERV